MLRYAITDLSSLPPADGLSPAETRRQQWLQDLRRWAAEGIGFVQLREKILHPDELFTLADEGMRLLHKIASEHPAEHPAGSSRHPQLLLNSRPDIAAAARADGVHLTGHPAELTPTQARTVFHTAGLPHCLVSISCHTPEEAANARQNGADLILFGPVYEKQVAGQQVTEGLGLTQLHAATVAAAPVPVLALGGITPQNTPACLDAGAAGIAAIRFFQTTFSSSQGAAPGKL